ncbi:hypothetical protein PM082_014397 [Marasmius tenuissimus]|nr:hypothetical protein PM082_014397 [Marasmius tenuissimus]
MQVLSGTIHHLVSPIQMTSEPFNNSTVQHNRDSNGAGTKTRASNCKRKSTDAGNEETTNKTSKKKKSKKDEIMAEMDKENASLRAQLAALQGAPEPTTPGTNAPENADAIWSNGNIQAPAQGSDRKPRPKGSKWSISVEMDLTGSTAKHLKYNTFTAKKAKKAARKQKKRDAHGDKDQQEFVQGLSRDGGHDLENDNREEDEHNKEDDV